MGNIIVIVSGGRCSGKMALCKELFLPGDMEVLSNYIAYAEFDKALSNVKEALTAAYEEVKPVALQMAELISEEAKRAASLFDTLSDLAKELEDKGYFEDSCSSYSTANRSKPIKCLFPTKVNKGQYIKKPVYYHCRDNC
jgi:uridine kinase